SNGNSFDIFLLDMIMPDMNGISLAREIAKKVKAPIIIFLTASKDHALEAYGVRAIRYLLKPVDTDSLSEAITLAYSQLKSRKKEKTFCIKTADGIQKIKYSHILYAEMAMRAIHIYKFDGNKIVSNIMRKSFEEEMAPLLNDKCFVQIHKSYIVNMDYIDTLGKSELTLFTGTKLPISRNHQSGTKKKFMEYFYSHIT
ncbi:MAG: LytR/AlgR family response regulator transcription factor, partial [Acutalibacteraceae bacterium]